MTGSAEVVQQSIEIVAWKIIMKGPKGVNGFMLVDILDQMVHREYRVRS
jgi:hypothetical protein